VLDTGQRRSISELHKVEQEIANPGVTAGGFERRRLRTRDKKPGHAPGFGRLANRS